MAIFQPSNIIPSSFAGIGLGVLDVNDNINISWQVNGNSPLTAFKIQIYNNLNNVLVYDGSMVTTVAFYGIDEKGNPKQFNYFPNGNPTWSSWGLSNGNEYKMIITQYWGTNNENSVTQWSGSVFKTEEKVSVELTPNKNAVGDYGVFRLTKDVVADKKYGIILPGSSLTFNFILSQDLPKGTLFFIGAFRTDAYTKGFYLYEGFIYEFSLTNTGYGENLPAESTDITVKNISSQEFSITGKLSKSVALNWVEWNVYTYNGFEVQDLIYSTGKIHTQELKLQTDLFSQNNFYLFECIVQTENGLESSATCSLFVSYGKTEFVADTSLSKNEIDGSLQVAINVDNISFNNFAIYKKFDNKQLLLYRGSLSENNYINLYSLRCNDSHYINVYGVTSGKQYSAPITLSWQNLQFSAYFLYETIQDETNPTIYNVTRIWRFGNNISTGAISNNNSPNWLTNFTPYRLKQPSSLMAKSGTLQALLSNNNSDKNFYNDTAQMMDRLFEASKSNNTFFLKDMKGNLYMVAISAPITQTIELKSKVQQVKVSLSWEEVGDASDVSLVYLQTESDLQTKTYDNNSNSNLSFEIVNTNLIANMSEGATTTRIYIDNEKGSVIAE